MSIILLLESQLVVFHRSLRDNKSPHVSRTLLSILADLNAVVRRVSTHLVISKSSSPCINPLVTVRTARITICITIAFMFHCFLIPTKVDVFVDYYKVWSSCRDYVICLYVKVPEEFVCFILHDRFWFVHIPFVGIVKLQCFAQFPVDHLTHPVVLSFIFFLREFSALLCDWWFSLYPQITYICSFAASYLFSLWDDWSF